MSKSMSYQGLFVQIPLIKQEDIRIQKHCQMFERLFMLCIQAKAGD